MAPTVPGGGPGTGSLPSFTQSTLEMGAREEGLWGLDPWFSVAPSLSDCNLESPSASAFPGCKNWRVRPHKGAGG